VKSWINVSTNPITTVDQKMSGFWTKVSFVFNQHAANVVAKKTSKVFVTLVGTDSSIIQLVCLHGRGILA